MRKILLCLMFLWPLPLSVWAESITIAAAANLQFPLDELRAEFNKETGIDVKTVIGASGQLTAQIENGAPFDVFMSADMKYPQTLAADGLVSDAPKTYAYGCLVLWTMKDADLSRSVAGLANANIKKIALASPLAAPYGRQSANAMKYYHLYPAVESKLVYGESIAQTNQFIATGAVDVGFTAKSVVLAPNMQGHGHWVDVGPQAYAPIAQGVVVLKYGRKTHSGAAQKFEDFLFSQPAQTIFKKYGYKPS